MTFKLGIASAVPLLLLTCGLKADGDPAYADIDKHALAATADDESSLENLAKYLVRPCRSDRDKARAIYRWITDRIAYDAEAFLNSKIDVEGNKSESVLKERKAVCQGFSALFMDLSGRMKLETERVEGHAKGLGYVAGSPLGDRERHAWVAAKINGRRQLIDPTWGAGHVDGKKFVKRFNDYYFLPPPDQLLFTHLPNDPKWQLVKNPLSDEEFRKRPRVDRRLFELKVSTEAVLSAIAEKDFRELVQLYAHPSTATYIVKAPLNKHLVAGEEYEFIMESDDYVDMAVFVDKIYNPMKQDGKKFTVKVEAKKGPLFVSGRKSKDVNVFSHVLGYVAE
jgi:hypothetical protein